MPVVSITRLRVRSWRYLPAFLVYALRSARQARRASQNLHVSLLREANRTFWTRTVWADETAIKDFMVSGAHRSVMPRILDWCDEASLVRWSQETAAPPSWPEAHRRLVDEGRRSRVRYPSDGQRDFRIPAPRLPAGA